MLNQNDKVRLHILVKTMICEMFTWLRIHLNRQNTQRVIQ